MPDVKSVLQTSDRLLWRGEGRKHSGRVARSQKVLGLGPQNPKILSDAVTGHFHPPLSFMSAPQKSSAHQPPLLRWAEPSRRDDRDAKRVNVRMQVCTQL